MSNTFTVSKVSSNFNINSYEKQLERRNKEFFEGGLKNLGVKSNSIEAYEFNTDREVLLSPAGINCFVDTCLHAYNDHVPLTLSPDDIWIVILQAFSAYINKNAEAVRHAFVQFEGKKKLTVVNYDFVKGSPDNNWNREFKKFSDLIAEHLGKKRDFFDARFSTTGPVETAAIQVQMMAAMASYFDYGMHTLCGIPEITLLGSTQDWEDIFQRVKASAEFYPDWARDPLERVTSNFASAAAGHPAKDFWENFVKVSGGSGGPYVSGYINAFFPYLTTWKNELVQNQYISGGQQRMGGGPSPENYPGSLCAVPMEWKYHDQVFNMKLVTGIVGTVHDMYDTFRPAIGWLVGEAVGEAQQGI